MNFYEKMSPHPRHSFIPFGTPNPWSQDNAKEISKTKQQIEREKKKEVASSGIRRIGNEEKWSVRKEE